MVFLVVAGIAYTKVQDGYGALDALSAKQNVLLSYNEDGQLIDRGTTEGADAIKQLLTDDWGFVINGADFDPNDLVVDTATEYMYQMATIGYHVLNGTQTIVLTEDKNTTARSTQRASISSRSKAATTASSTESTRSRARAHSRRGRHSPSD